MTDTSINAALQAQTDRIGAPQIGRELIAAKLSDRPVPYTAVYRAIVSGAVPAEQIGGNRWTVSRADLPRIAAALGLRAPAQSVAA